MNDGKQVQKVLSHAIFTLGPSFDQMENSSSASNASSSPWWWPPCPDSFGATPDQQAWASAFGRFSGLYLQSAMALLGCLGNVAAAAVICNSKRLSSAPFNQILVCYLSLHSAYLVANFLTEVRRGKREEECKAECQEQAFAISCLSEEDNFCAGGDLYSCVLSADCS